MVGQLVESNGDRFYLAPKLHHPNACTVGKVLPKFDHFFQFPQSSAKRHFTQPQISGTSLLQGGSNSSTDQVFFCFKKWKLFPFAAREKDNFSKQVDRLTFACGNFFSGQFWGTVGLRGGIFGQVSVAFDPIFLYFVQFFYVLRNCVKQLRRFFVKSKNENII